MRVRLIINPSADRGRAGQLLQQLETWNVGSDALDVVPTETAGHGQALAAEAAAAGYDVVAAAGGDGTVNEVVNGLLQDVEPFSVTPGPALGIVPIGSGNDYAFGLGLKTPPLAAVQRLFTGARQAVDVARVVDNHGRHCIMCNGLGIGLDAAVTIESLKIKRLYGFPAYLLAALKTIFLGYRTPTLSLLFDDARVAQPALLLAVGVGPRVGGGFRLTPEASFDDGLLDSCLVEPVSRLTMLAMLTRVMKGTHVTSKFVEMRRNQAISVTSDRPLPVHVDGEIFARLEDDVRELTITSWPRALEVVT